jgi:hypothetical protein
MPGASTSTNTPADGAPRAGQRDAAPALTYVYAILEADTPAAAALAGAAPTAGIGGAPVRGVQHSGLVAAVSAVPSAEFEEEPLNHLMRELAWLGPRAEAHQAVNARLASLADALLPLAFGTIFRADASLRAYLDHEQRTLHRRLDAVRGRQEWVLALRRDDATLRAAVQRESAALRALHDEMAASTPGRAYLLRRREEEVARREAERLDIAAADAVVALVETLGGRTYRERIATTAEGAAPAPKGQLIFRLSALLGRETAGPLTAAVSRFEDEWRARGYTLAATGPWPPYRFGAVSGEDPQEMHPVRQGDDGGK